MSSASRPADRFFRHPIAPPSPPPRLVCPTKRSDLPEWDVFYRAVTALPHIWSLPRLQEVFPFPMDDRCSHISGLCVEGFAFRASMKFRAFPPDQVNGLNGPWGESGSENAGQTGPSSGDAPSTHSGGGSR